MQTITKDDTTALILAGGRGSRLDGQDKGLLTYHSRHLYEHQIAALQQQAATVWINANRNLDRYAAAGLPVIRDQFDNFQGPLAGLYTALTQVKTPWLISVPCDAPYIAADYVQQMRQAVAARHVKIAVATDGKRQQPVYLLIHRTLAANLLAYLTRGERKIDRWYQQLDFVEVSFATAATMFININTRDEWDAFMRSESVN